jgi:hypothetical protein
VKVKISVTVEVNPQEWTQTYGVEGAKEIREDVKSYIVGQIQGSAAADECSMTVVSR